jgi:hypothetical protein
VPGRWTCRTVCCRCTRRSSSSRAFPAPNSVVEARQGRECCACRW